MTTKQKLEQLGWVIRHCVHVIEFSYQRSEGEEIDFINYDKSFKEWDFTRVRVYGITHTELQLILDYLKELKDNEYVQGRTNIELTEILLEYMKDLKI